MSTVSKIVNGKDKGIKPETRERVLAIVKEYNYTPYASVKSKWIGKTFLLGFLSSGNKLLQGVLDGVMQRAQSRGYGVLFCNSYGDGETELKNITMLCRNHVDGVIWDKVNEQSDGLESYFTRQEIPFSVVGSSFGHQDEQLRIDYAQLGYNATDKLVKRGHRRIGCLTNSSGAASKAFADGFRRCMFENQLVFDENKCIIDSASINQQIFMRDLTGFVCIDQAKELCKLAEQRNVKIPERISVVGLSEDSNVGDSQISLIPIPFQKYGSYACDFLISRIEKAQSEPARDFSWDITAGDESVDIPYDSRWKSILVIGSVNMDVLINMDELPQAGKTVAARAVNTIPGGKGLNQAVGAAKLGANVSLIARLGSDFEGTGIHAILHNHRVDVRGVITDDRVNTGKAYIYVQSDGDSSIIIYAGANNNLSAADVMYNEGLYRDAGYCLLPMEIPEKTVEFAIDMAKRYGLKTILKPTALHSISDTLLKNIDIFVPNEKEANDLCPGSSTVEEKALYFLQKGAGTVIITLGPRGCYLKSKNNERFFKAANFSALDTTGGADAFISALAVYLNEGRDMSDAIRLATCAAGFCVSRQGTLPAMVDRTTLELYLANNYAEA